jgi:Tfp pilus assembly PilM family ATPase
MMLPSFLRTPPPDVAIAIDAGYVAAASLVWRSGQPVIAAHAVEPLPAGAVIPSLASPNLADPAVVGAAVKRAVAGLGRGVSRVALVLPDIVARVSLIRFEKIPPRAAELDEMLRWQVRKSAPFPLEQAVVSSTPGIVPPEGGREFVVTVARQDIIEQYEQACQLAGVHAGLVDLATFSVINGVMAGPHRPSGDWLLVHVTPTHTALAVVRGEHLIFIRNRSEDAEGTLTDVVHQTAMYYEDRLTGTGFSQVLLAGSSNLAAGVDTLRKGLEERLRLSVELVDVRTAAALTDRIEAPVGLLDRLAPLVGVLLREQRAA